MNTASTYVVSVSESEFVKALSELVGILRQRDQEGFTSFIGEDDLLSLERIVLEMELGNIDEMLSQLTEILTVLGETQGRAVNDNSDSLYSIAFFLNGMMENPLRPALDSSGPLIEVLEQKIGLFHQKSEALKAYES